MHLHQSGSHTFAAFLAAAASLDLGGIAAILLTLETAVAAIACSLKVP